MYTLDPSSQYMQGYYSLTPFPATCCNASVVPSVRVFAHKAFLNILNTIETDKAKRSIPAHPTFVNHLDS